MERTLFPYYKGRKVALHASQQDDGQWICNYGIIEAPTWIAANKGRADGTYPTREAAEAAGLKKAQCIIDSREPMS